ncbi:MAG: phasin family protein [Spirochaetota bacterium]|nr:phasin family protein [Spirochaetota bacterium]
MLDFIKKSLFMGLGAVMVTYEKAEQLVDELIKRGELAIDDRSDAIKDLVKKAEEQEKILSDKINTEVSKVIDKIGITTKKELERLEEKIDELKKKIG